MGIRGYGSFAGLVIASRSLAQGIRPGNQIPEPSSAEVIGNREAKGALKGFTGLTIGHLVRQHVSFIQDASHVLLYPAQTVLIRRKSKRTLSSPI